MACLLNKRITISVPITQEFRQQAETFANFQLSSAKGKQVYCNMLAVLVTQTYLEMQDIPFELERSYSSNLASHLSMDVADIYIPEVKGRLDCRSVQSGSSGCFVPERIMDDCIGSIVVELNKQYTEGKILGFIKQVFNTEVSLNDLGSLDDFIDCLPDAELDSEENLTPKLVNSLS